MAFRSQREYKVIFRLILHRDTTQENLGLPALPKHGSNLYPDIHNFQSLPWRFLSLGMFKSDLELEW